jgi:hypothetical protein
MYVISTDRPRLVVIGETLWDLFPDAAVWDDPPGNVACHAAGLGVAAAMISRVGCDDYGDRGLAALAAHEVDCRFPQRDVDRPTGSVRVTLSPTGDATYQFAADTAHDQLAWQTEFPPLAVAVEAVCFWHARPAITPVARDEASFPRCRAHGIPDTPAPSQACRLAKCRHRIGGLLLAKVADRLGCHDLTARANLHDDPTVGSECLVMVAA